MMYTYSNIESINKKRLEMFSLVAKRTLTALMGQCDDGILKSLKNNNDLEELLSNMDTVMLHKLRDKFKI